MKLTPARILDFDLENRPLSYWIPDRPTAEITGIAWSWIGSDDVVCILLGAEGASYEVDGRYSVGLVPEILERFVEAYNQADIVTGHYITRHDLPIINGALIENGLPILEHKLASDTKTQLVKRADIPATQEALGQYLGLEAPKVHMTQAMWREANRLTQEGLEGTYERVVGDVLQHKEMRLELLARGLLHAPKVWRP